MPDGFDARHPIVQDALAGLLQTPKTLPAKLLYDDAGCDLFAQITTLAEYYPTRTEIALLRHVAPNLPSKQPQVLVEYGASDSAKASILLDQLQSKAYVPIDVAETALDAIVAQLSRSHPGVQVHPIATDFLQTVTLPSTVEGLLRFGFFPGSTIGNLDPVASSQFLRNTGDTLGSGAFFLVGVDLLKSPSILLPAYNDSRGVTAAFNMNLLTRLNREAAATFDLGQFQHRADWNAQLGRIEMHLVSQRKQTVLLAGHPLTFESGETIHTESSYKHTIEGFKMLAASSGWDSVDVWTDDRELFSLHLLRWTGM